MGFIKVVIKICFPARPKMPFGWYISLTYLRNIYEWELGSKGVGISETILSNFWSLLDSDPWDIVLVFFFLSTPHTNDRSLHAMAGKFFSFKADSFSGGGKTILTEKPLLFPGTQANKKGLVEVLCSEHLSPGFLRMPLNVYHVYLPLTPMIDPYIPQVKGSGVFYTPVWKTGRILLWGMASVHKHFLFRLTPPTVYIRSSWNLVYS